MDSGAINASNAGELAERLRWEQQDYWVHLEAESPLEKYPAKQHARRVAEELRTLGRGDGLIYLPGTPSRNIEDSDMPIKWRQRRYFYYVSGCNEPDCHLTYDTDIDRLVLYIPRIDPRKALYNGRGSTRAEALQKYDIDDVHYVDELPRAIKYWQDYHSGSVYALHPSQFPPAGKESRRGMDLTPSTRFDAVWLQPAMNRARIIKDEHEIKLIKKANDISSQAHAEVLANILRFKNEAQVEGLFLNYCISKQAKEQAYDPIAASGPNAGTLHYSANNEDFGDRQLMCLDASCEYELYASDITRTFPLSGAWPSNEARNIYHLVERMQDACIKRVAPGVRYLDLHILAHQIAIDGLISLGILHNGTREEIFKAGTSRAFFPHGLGHHVGLEVHDVGQGELMSITKSGRNAAKAPSLYPEDFHLPVWSAAHCMAPADPHSPHLEENMVVTIEPGIYFSSYMLTNFYLPDPIHSRYINLKVLKKYMPIGGVRIEDDIRVTSKGYENLTTAPKGEEMIEIIRKQKSDWPYTSNPKDSSTSDRIPKYPRRSLGEPEPLERAPGISKDAPHLMQMPLARAQTLPSERRERRSVDFEPFDGPSLFSGFKRASTVDEVTLGQRRTTSKQKIARVSVCGDDSSDFEHSYVGFSGEAHSRHSMRTGTKKPLCQSCCILVQTLGRLRQNLPKSVHSSPNREKKQTQEPPPPPQEEQTRQVRRVSTMPCVDDATTIPSLRSHSSIPDLPHRKSQAEFVKIPSSTQLHSRRTQDARQQQRFENIKEESRKLDRASTLPTFNPSSADVEYLYRKSLNPQGFAPPFYTGPFNDTHSTPDSKTITTTSTKSFPSSTAPSTALPSRSSHSTPSYSEKTAKQPYTDYINPSQAAMAHSLQPNLKEDKDKITHLLQKLNSLDLSQPGASADFKAQGKELLRHLERLRLSDKGLAETKPARDRGSHKDAKNEQFELI
ncbi:hypothetical protein BU24DRAFT_466827 [Aaosphaeria arxii CBS 175.79]|uniref:Xaa-Pro aminopeptidase n=1 Tax=Aaosphaeria arxii CBS 175.79 TaxID=1450172 RepID=A0A6A5XDL1_9PLEO|nr:uncharacterized protein BU24DRAFT_466827 [Aaosphaeria arxii CBS 175.79]KAF2011098.1 hypothetical protein BU24DRAFT_466827 [Aaosphaeria arxii CBS 175.79]